MIKLRVVRCYRNPDWDEPAAAVAERDAPRVRGHALQRERERERGRERRTVASRCENAESVKPSALF